MNVFKLQTLPYVYLLLVNLQTKPTNKRYIRGPNTLRKLTSLNTFKAQNDRLFI